MTGTPLGGKLSSQRGWLESAEGKADEHECDDLNTLEASGSEGGEEPYELSSSIFWYIIMPIVFILTVPTAVVCTVSFVIKYCATIPLALESGFLIFMWESCTAHGLGPRDCWQFILAFSLYSSLSIEALRGKKYWGPTTSSGHKPVYWNTGFTYYLMTIGLAALVLLKEDLPCFAIYQSLPGFTVALVIAGAFVSVLLFLMGTMDPSPGEYGVTGNIVFDFYWGIELYPRIGDRFDMKMWFNSRFGMMLWQLLVIACWKAQVDTSGWNWAMATSALLQSAYIAKFFWWEDVYMQSMDITVDRGGFYMCWSHMAFVPTMHSLASVYMVENPPHMSRASAAVILAVGVVMILLTCWCQCQKLRVQQKKGDCNVWGSPAKVIRAEFKDASGNDDTKLLVASGFWSICRHPNHVFEILAGLCWVLPSGNASVVPYFYVIFLVAWLVYRTNRFERLCAKKYGKHWKEYCSLVKYRMIPYVF
ncbi:hypothetical protein HPB50_026844 [Hyalomma asiaticum]|uniref:Uncharacterized protein n=1 Tax=Hyalomma asiaticum TaxID=266040 RepID=A0ACB7S874_HYAAI|nr:hypothetical protein HPB50_026844 [Hyalomma asiaticum]